MDMNFKYIKTILYFDPILKNTQNTILNKKPKTYYLKPTT